MAEALAKCAKCGEKYIMTGQSQAAADSMVAFAERRGWFCEACVQAEDETGLTEEVVEALAKAKAAGLPALTGKKKEVAEAVMCRQDMIEKFAGDRAVVQEMVSEIVADQTTAKKWYYNVRREDLWEYAQQDTATVEKVKDRMRANMLSHGQPLSEEFEAFLAGLTDEQVLALRHRT
jgi:hypothetical protein